MCGEAYSRVLCLVGKIKRGVRPDTYYFALKILETYNYKRERKNSQRSLERRTGLLKSPKPYEDEYSSEDK